MRCCISGQKQMRCQGKWRMHQAWRCDTHKQEKKIHPQILKPQTPAILLFFLTHVSSLHLSPRRKGCAWCCCSLKTTGSHSQINWEREAHLSFAALASNPNQWGHCGSDRWIKHCVIKLLEGIKHLANGQQLMLCCFHVLLMLITLFD